MLPATLQFLIVLIAFAIDDRLQRKLDFVKEEMRVLWEQLHAAAGGEKLSFTTNQRRRLAEAGNLLEPDGRQKRCPTRHRNRPNHRREHPDRGWHRAGAAAREDPGAEAVHEGALGFALCV